MGEDLLSIGVDGCRAGWLVIALGDDGVWQYRVADKLKHVIKELPQEYLMLVDMPLGLLSGAGRERECDHLARKLLGRPRSSSVFPPPARPTLAAGDYVEAQVINRRCLGRGLSQQAWNLVPKIRELDRLRRKEHGVADRLRESHPEVCFWALNKQRSPLHNKKTLEGRRERIRILSRHQHNAKEIIEVIAQSTLRKDVAWDDIVDALVLAVTARLGQRQLQTLPAPAPKDRYGIAMEIVYAVVNADRCP